VPSDSKDRLLAGDIPILVSDLSGDDGEAEDVGLDFSE